jgi:hypothetical protein
MGNHLQQKHFSRRQFVRLMMAAGLGTVLVSCSDEEPQATQPAGRQGREQDEYTNKHARSGIDTPLPKLNVSKISSETMRSQSPSQSLPLSALGQESLTSEPLRSVTFLINGVWN